MSLPSATSAALEPVVEYKALALAATYAAPASAGASAIEVPRPHHFLNVSHWARLRPLPQRGLDLGCQPWPSLIPRVVVSQLIVAISLDVTENRATAVGLRVAPSRLVSPARCCCGSLWAATHLLPAFCLRCPLSSFGVSVDCCLNRHHCVTPVFHDVAKHKFPLIMLIIIFSYIRASSPEPKAMVYLHLKLASGYVFAVSVAALCFVYHEVNDTKAEAGESTSRKTSLGEHRVPTPFSDVAGSERDPNTCADVLSADVGVYRLELLMGGSYQVCHSNDSNFSSDTARRPENPHAFYQSMFVISTVPIQSVCISLSRSTRGFVWDSVCHGINFKVCTKRGYSFPQLRWIQVFDERFTKETPFFKPPTFI